MMKYFNIEKNGKKTECRLDFDYDHQIWDKFDGNDYFEEFDPKEEFPGLDFEKLQDEVILGELQVPYELGNGYTLDLNPGEHNVDFKLVYEEKEDVLLPFSIIHDKDMREYLEWERELPYFAEGLSYEIYNDVIDHSGENYVCCEFWKDRKNSVDYRVNVEVNPADVPKHGMGVVVRLSHEIIGKGYVDLEDEDCVGFPAVFWEDDQGFHDVNCPRDFNFDEYDWGDFYGLIEYDQKRNATYQLGDRTLIINEG